MELKIKYLICILLTLGTLGFLFALQPIAQDPAFHLFADNRTILGIPNFWNVFSNIPFIVVAAMGFLILKKKGQAIFSIPFILVAGIFLTGLGSAWYHLNPSNDSLVWDRIPMTIVFMSFLSFIISKRIGELIAATVFIPLLITGIFSVLYWKHTEELGAGDLRLYGWVQFFPMIMIIVLMALFVGANNFIKEMIFIVLFYAIAKCCEHYDKNIFDQLMVISGHSIKHLFAAGSTWYIIKLISLPPPVANEQNL